MHDDYERATKLLDRASDKLNQARDSAQKGQYDQMAIRIESAVEFAEMAVENL